MNTARLDDVIKAVGPDFHGLSYRERLIVGAVLKRLSTPPADDVREALAKAFADALFHAGVRAPSSTLAVIAFKEVLTAFEVRPRGTVTDVDAPEIPGFEGTHAAVDGLSIRGGESS